MASGAPFNGSFIDDTHFCFKIDLASLTLTRKFSPICLFFYVALGSVSTITVCGNFLVILSVIYFKQLHSPTNSFILSLAVADLLVGLLIFPLSTQHPVKLCMYSHNALCKLREIFDVTLSTASILNLCCISFDRYYAVCKPLIYKAKMNSYTVLIMIFSIWCLAFLVSLGFLLARLNFEKCPRTCFFSIFLVNILGPALLFFLPTILMVCVYLKILLVALKQARSIYNTNGLSVKHGTTARKMESKATKTLAIVMGVFLTCWLPLFLCLTLQLADTVIVPFEVFETLVWFALSNSMLNPFIYAVFYSWFRSAFRLILTGKIFCGDVSAAKLL